MKNGNGTPAVPVAVRSWPKIAASRRARTVDIERLDRCELCQATIPRFRHTVTRPPRVLRFCHECKARLWSKGHTAEAFE